MALYKISHLPEFGVDIRFWIGWQATHGINNIAKIVMYFDIVGGDDRIRIAEPQSSVNESRYRIIILLERFESFRFKGMKRKIKFIEAQVLRSHVFTSVVKVVIIATVVMVSIDCLSICPQRGEGRNEDCV